jgi:hypothetical protein
VNIRLDRRRRLFPVILGVITLACVGLLLAQDFLPGLSPAWSHGSLAALALAMIAVAYVIYEIAHRPAPLELVKAILLMAAFLFWAANQYWPNIPQAALFNDFAIALFVFDVFLVIAGWPPASGDASFAETAEENCGCCCHRGENRNVKALRT